MKIVNARVLWHLGIRQPLEITTFFILFFIIFYTILYLEGREGEKGVIILDITRIMHDIRPYARAYARI